MLKKIKTMFLVFSLFIALTSLPLTMLYAWFFKHTSYFITAQILWVTLLIICFLFINFVKFDNADS